MKYKLSKATVMNDEKMQVFGFASVAGIEDLQGDVIETDELEQAVYSYINLYGDMGEEHNATLKKKGKIIESVVLTKEKASSMGITPPDKDKWWVGFQINNKKTWEKVKNGDYAMFSIEGNAERVEKNTTTVNNEPLTFAEVYYKLKNNPAHYDAIVQDLFKLNESENESAKDYSKVISRMEEEFQRRKDDEKDPFVKFLSMAIEELQKIRNDERNHDNIVNGLINYLIGKPVKEE